MKRVILLLSLLILLLPLINLVSASVGDGGIILRIINNRLEIIDYYEGFPNVNTTGNNISFTSFDYDLSNQMICNLTVNGTIYNNTSQDIDIINTATYPTDCYLNSNYTKTISLKNEYVLYLRNLNQTCNETVIAVDEGKIFNYTQCLDEKAACNILKADCLNKYDQINATNIDYVKCVSDLSACDTTRGPLQTTIDTLNKEKEDSKNTKYVYGVIGVAVGFVATMFFTGKWNKSKIKHPDENFNRSQSA